MMVVISIWIRLPTTLILLPRLLLSLNSLPILECERRWANGERRRKTKWALPSFLPSSLLYTFFLWKVKAFKRNFRTVYPSIVRPAVLHTFQSLRSDSLMKVLYLRAVLSESAECGILLMSTTR